MRRLSLQLARATALGLSVLALAGCATRPAGTLPPRLVVMIVVDGLPQWQVTAYRDQLAPDGLARFLDKGAWFSDAHYSHAYTVTGAGHATLLTGAYPHRTGIIGNEWRDPETGAEVYCAADPSYRFIAQPKARALGTGPRNLRAESLGDVLRAASPESKVIAISGKDRGAVLPAGRSGTAYVYLPETGGFSSTTRYMESHPAWVEAFNGAKPSDRYFGKAWEPLLPDMAYARSVPDAQPWMAPAATCRRARARRRRGRVSTPTSITGRSSMPSRSTSPVQRSSVRGSAAMGRPISWR